MNTSEIENILRTAPRPSVPAALRGRLCAQAPRRGISGTNRAMLSAESSVGWIRRWWPALAPAAVSLACATIFTLQQLEIRDLEAAIRTSPVAAEPVATTTARGTRGSGIGGADATTVEKEEITRLKAMAAQLASEISQLEQMRLQNEQMRKQLAARSAAGFTPEETKALEEARDRASSIQCVNNLKQLGLAVRMWSVDNGDISPPNVQCLSNYIGSYMKTFVCPADTGRQAAVDARSFTPANSSYEYLAPSAPDNEPNRVLFRCPIHGNIGLIDGSVQRGLAKNHPESLVQQDGKLYVK
jgi:hypothetical protein